MHRSGSQPVMMQPMSSRDSRKVTTSLGRARSGTRSSTTLPHTDIDDSAGFLTKGRGVRAQDRLLSAEGQFHISPCQVSFGVVPMGSSLIRKPITIRNLGASPARFRAFGLSRKDISLEISEGPMAIAPGMCASIMVLLKPKEIGGIFDQLVVRAGQEEHRIPIQACIVANVDAEDSIEGPPKETMRFVRMIPRLPRSYFDWKTQEIVREREMPYKLDPNWTIMDLRKWELEQEREEDNHPLPPYGIGICNDKRPHDKIEEEKQKRRDYTLDPSIARLLNEPEEFDELVEE